MKINSLYFHYNHYYVYVYHHHYYYDYYYAGGKVLERRLLGQQSFWVYSHKFIDLDLACEIRNADQLIGALMFRPTESSFCFSTWNG